MRNYLQNRWADYVSGTLDLAAVAVTTNVALEILQRAETHLVQSMPKKFNLTTYSQISGLLYNALALSRGVDVNARQQPGDVINMDLKEMADFTSMPVAVILKSFLSVLEINDLPVMKQGFYGEIDMSGRKLSWRERFNQHKIILLELLPEICVINALGHLPPVVDELSRGLIEMMKSKEIPIWLVLGCQLYLDIFDVTALHPFGNITNAHKELQVAGLHAAQTLKSYAKFSEKLSVETWPEENDAMLQYVRNETEFWICNDAYLAGRKEIFALSAQRQADAVQPYSLFSRQPLLCGLMLFRLNINLEYLGIALVNAWGSLPSVLHLYNAVKHEDPNADFPLWEDFEAVIKIHGKERIFIGDYPNNPEQYLKRFCLVMGYSASMLAANRREGRNTRQTQTPASKRGPREMTTTSTIGNIFKPQYCDKTANSDVTFHRLQELLFASPKKQERTSPFLLVTFLSSLCEKIQAEILAINIDYFALHMRCYDLLRDIRRTLDSEFVKYVGSPMYIEKENQLPFLVGYLFNIAVRSARTAETFKFGGRDDKVTSRTLLKAAGVVKKLVLEEGSREIGRIEASCRGFDMSYTGIEKVI